MDLASAATRMLSTPALTTSARSTRLHVKTHSSAFDPGNVEQVFDQSSLSSDRPFDGVSPRRSVFAKRQVTK